MNQYVESVPTTKGSKPATRRSRDEPRPLPPQVRRKLRAQGGQVAEELEEIATSPALGAPPAADSTRRPGTPGARGGAGDARVERDGPGVVSALGDAATAGGAGATAALLGGLLLVAGLVGGMAASRRRSATS